MSCYICEERDEYRSEDCARLIDHGCALFEVGDIYGALDKWGWALQVAPPGMRYLALYNKGVAQWDLGNHELAIESWAASLRLNPFHQDAVDNWEMATGKKFKPPREAQHQLALTSDAGEHDSSWHAWRHERFEAARRERRRRMAMEEAEASAANQAAIDRLLEQSRSGADPYADPGNGYPWRRKKRTYIDIHGREQELQPGQYWDPPVRMPEELSRQRPLRLEVVQPPYWCPTCKKGPAFTLEATREQPAAAAE